MVEYGKYSNELYELQVRWYLYTSFNIFIAWVLRLDDMFPVVYVLCKDQRYTYRVLQTIQMKLILLYVWAKPAVLASTKTALKFKYQI